MTGGVPTMFIAQLSHPEFSKFDVSSLRAAFMGESPCPVELLKRVNSEMNCREIAVVCRQTEASPVIPMTALDHTRSSSAPGPWAGRLQTSKTIISRDRPRMWKWPSSRR